MARRYSPIERLKMNAAERYVCLAEATPYEGLGAREFYTERAQEHLNTLRYNHRTAKLSKRISNVQREIRAVSVIEALLIMQKINGGVAA